MNAKRDADRLSTTLSVDITQVSKTDWRVSNSADQVLGYVEQLSSHRYEVMWLTEPLRWGYTSTFPDAIAAVAGADESVAEIWPERDEESQVADHRYDSASVTPPPLAVRAHHRATWQSSG